MPLGMVMQRCQRLLFAMSSWSGDQYCDRVYLFCLNVWRKYNYICNRSSSHFYPASWKFFYSFRGTSLNYLVNLPGTMFVLLQEDPYFHYYLQSITPGNATAAIMGVYTSAAQFQVTGGQLIQESTPPLYAIVEDRANSTVMKLGVSWSETPATSGTFDFSGDTIEWSIPTIDRPQVNVGISGFSEGIKLDSFSSD